MELWCEHVITFVPEIIWRITYYVLMFLWPIFGPRTTIEIHAGNEWNWTWYASWGEGGPLDFKWQGWSNGGKNQNPKKSLYQNLTPQKSETEFPNHKNFPESIKWYNTKIGPFSFEHPKKSLLKIKLVPQKILAKIFLLKSIPNWKFQTQKNLSSVAVTWNPEYPPPRRRIKTPQNLQWSTITLRCKRPLPK